MKQSDLRASSIEALARELVQLDSEIIIGAYSDSRHRPYHLGQSLNKLWAVPVESEWVITGVCGKREYDAQIELIRRIRPEWPNKFESPRHGSATFFTLMPAEAQ